MWKNLRDVGSLAQKISAVVAPPGPDGEEELVNDHGNRTFPQAKNHENREDETDDEYDEDNEDDEDDYDNDNIQQQRGGPFGFVNMISRTMNAAGIGRNESEAEEVDDEENDYEEEEDEDEEYPAQSLPEVLDNNAFFEEQQLSGEDGEDNMIDLITPTITKVGSVDKIDPIVPTLASKGANNTLMKNTLDTVGQMGSDLDENDSSLFVYSSIPLVKSTGTPTGSQANHATDTGNEIVSRYETVVATSATHHSEPTSQLADNNLPPELSNSDHQDFVDFPSGKTIPDTSFVDTDDDDDDDDDDLEDEDLENNESIDGSISVNSDLDGKDRKERVVARLQDKQQNDPSNEEVDEGNNRNELPSRLGRLKANRGNNLSTDSLLEGDFARKLREERRINTRRTYGGDGDVKQTNQETPILSDEVTATTVSRPSHRIVEVPKSDVVLQAATAARQSIRYDDVQHDELDVPLHKGGRNVGSLPEDLSHINQTAHYVSTNGSFSSLSEITGKHVKSDNQLGTKSQSADIVEYAQNNAEIASKPSDCSHKYQNTNSQILVNEYESNVVPSADITYQIHELEKRCQDLQHQLEQRENQVLELQKQISRSEHARDQKEETTLELLKVKEQRLLEAADEDHQFELKKLEEEWVSRLQNVQRDLEEERMIYEGERDQFEFLLNEANARAENAEQIAKKLETQNENSIAKLQQQHARTLNMSEDKLVRALALIDEKEENERKLKDMIHKLQSKMSEHHEGAKEVEEELDEIHQENEELQRKVEKLESEKKRLTEKVDKLQSDADNLSHLKLEMRMLKEENDREKAKRQTVAASAESTTAQLIASRDDALAEVQDLKQQLAAALADIDVARSDAERLITANNNLQSALEAFQMEKEAELSLWEESKAVDIQALEAAHAATLEATRQVHENEMQMIQKASDAAIRNAMNEMKLLEENVEMYRVENFQMRRSLDEAISRLQVTQDDVIDRSFMKNVLFDWLTKRGVKERRDVLELMASILHFTEEEKEQVHIGTSHVRGSLTRFVVGPLPEPKADIEHLEGENVTEKFVNFLLAETDD